MLFDWVKAQTWWRYVRPMIEDGLHVIVHVQDMPPGLETHVTHVPTGGVVHIEQCPAHAWHIAMALSPVLASGPDGPVGRAWPVTTNDELN